LQEKGIAGKSISSSDKINNTNAFVSKKKLITRYISGEHVIIKNFQDTVFC